MLGLFHLIRPAGGPLCRLLQPADLPFQLLVPGQLPPVPVLFVPEPAGEGPPHQLRTGVVQGQDVVHTAIQKSPVVGHQQEPPAQITEVFRHQRPARAVQMVGGLVDHRVGLLVQEEPGQKRPGLLPTAEGGERPVQQFLPQPQLGQLPVQPPLLPRWGVLQQDVPRAPALVRHRPGPQPAAPLEGDGPPALQLPRQQAEEGGLAPAVPAHQAQFPVGVQLEVQPLKHRGVVPVVGEIQVLYGDLRHIASLLSCARKSRKRDLPLAAAGAQYAHMSRKGKTARFLSRTHDRTGLFSQPRIISCHGISKWFCASSRLPSVCRGQHTTGAAFCQELASVKEVFSGMPYFSAYFIVQQLNFNRCGLILFLPLLSNMYCTPTQPTNFFFEKPSCFFCCNPYNI